MKNKNNIKRGLINSHLEKITGEDFYICNGHIFNEELKLGRFIDEDGIYFNETMLFWRLKLHFIGLFNNKIARQPLSFFERMVFQFLSRKLGTKINSIRLADGVHIGK